MEVDTERTGEPHAQTVYLVLDGTAANPDPGRRASGRLRSLSGQGVRRRRACASPRRSSVTGIPGSVESSASAPAARAGGGRWRSRRRETIASRPPSLQTLSAAGRSGSRPGPIPTRVGSTSTTARWPPVRPTSAGSSRKALCCSVPARSTSGGQRRPDAPTASATGPSKAPSWVSTSSANGLGSAPGTSCFPAPSEASRVSPQCCRSSRHSASTSSTCRLSTRSGSRTARAGTTPSARGRETPAARGRSEPTPAAMTALHPDLGTDADFDAMVAGAKAAGLELALDFAIQCSPDHPWLVEHPEWFERRPDGTLKYAENPPKRYQDIYNLDWDTGAREKLWNTLRDVVLGWCARGIRVYRVDNPHTKPVPFWEWLIAEVRAAYPGCDLPRRGVHPAGADDDARQGRLQPVVYVLHVEEHEGRARRVRRPGALVVGVLPPEHVAEHAGHPPRVPCRRAAARRSRPGSFSPPRCRRATGSTRATRPARMSPCGRAARSISTRRSTR